MEDCAKSRQGTSPKGPCRFSRFFYVAAIGHKSPRSTLAATLARPATRVKPPTSSGGAGRYHPEGRFQHPGVISSTELPSGSRT